jgi:hypothetical protein
MSGWLPSYAANAIHLLSGEYEGLSCCSCFIGTDFSIAPVSGLRSSRLRPRSFLTNIAS